MDSTYWDRPLNFDDTFHRHVYNPLDDTFHGHVHNLLDHFFHRHVHNPFHYLPLHRLDNLLRALHLLHDALDHRRLRLRLDDERCDLLRRWQMTLREQFPHRRRILVGWQITLREQFHHRRIRLGSCRTNAWQAGAGGQEDAVS